MQQIAGEQCADGNTCNGIFLEGDTVMFRGGAVEAATLPRAAHEAVVGLPLADLLEAAANAKRMGGS
jgi:hypothetical protein